MKPNESGLGNKFHKRLEKYLCTVLKGFVNHQAHIIAKQQVADEILNCQHFTFACDATSRQKAHYLEQHIVLSNGKTMSLGFSEIACVMIHKHF